MDYEGVRQRSPISPKELFINVQPSPTEPTKSQKKALKQFSCYIRLLGNPVPFVKKCTSDILSKPNESDKSEKHVSTNLENTQSCNYDNTMTEIVDILDSKNEDPFTLEPFEDLIRAHIEHGKDFIIARVKTVDPHDESRFYYSYYTAHHINKILFRTQPEEGLLHRMKSKNPLNNMTIIGDVHYYVIPKKTLSDPNFPTPTRHSFDTIRKYQRPHSANSLKLLNKLDTFFHLHHAQLKIHPRPTSPTDTTPHSPLSPQSPHSDSGINYSTLRHNLHTNSFRNTTSTSNDISDWIKTNSETTYYDAHYYASDDDFLMCAEVRRAFKECALACEDAVLFTISKDCIEEEAVEMEPHPALPGFVFSVAQTRVRMSLLVKVLLVLYFIIGLVFVGLFVTNNL
ncbi:hypothetical protein HK096_005902, partial [Nowakowskiella sp. JEL0078]